LILPALQSTSSWLSCGRYGGFRDSVSVLLERFWLREERKPEAAE
jgi:hypothetical protein